ncbi:MAG: dTDP-4-dehydrorhamnose 3,5-epimerase [Bdellovibrionales bacterium RIFOXYD1_FULL_44_7]|nr:MAG: dTDP-4-dehydrorhamnose 3,5-epimerase [Bdellovibrionales bacterium RIFOXYD1_FULL_44_7]
MNVIDLEIPGLKLIELRIFRDQRGFFSERFNANEVKEYGLPGIFAQDNHSRSVPNVVRGMHLQFDPPQSKLVGVIRGRVWDVAVDLRPSSPTFGKYYGVELTGDNGLLFWIPFGFAHGFCVLGDEPADMYYKIDNVYNPKGETGVSFSDPDIDIKWPLNNPVVSERDRSLPGLKDFTEKYAGLLKSKFNL